MGPSAPTGETEGQKGPRSRKPENAAPAAPPLPAEDELFGLPSRDVLAERKEVQHGRRALLVVDREGGHRVLLHLVHKVLDLRHVRQLSAADLREERG